jgi:thiol:disulfide interchange protein DsbD
MNGKVRFVSLVVLAAMVGAGVALFLCRSVGAADGDRAVKPTPPVKATITGVNYCVSCELKSEAPAAGEAQPRRLFALRVSKVVTGDGQERPEMRGWVLHYLPSARSDDLMKTAEGRVLTVQGTIYPVERVLAVEKFEAAAQVKDLVWQSSLDKALAEAKKDRKLVVIDFYAEWCGWCRVMDEETYTDAKVREKLAGFALAKIDTDQDEATAGRYGVSGLPTTLVVDESGQEVARRIGYVAADEFLKFLKEAAEGRRPR